jgi:hypothetical protein
MKKIDFKFLALVFVLAFSSCSSDDSGDSNGVTTGNYFPMAVNNKWEFTNGSIATEAKIVGTTEFSGITYYEMNDTSVELDIQNWVTKKGASYYQKVATSTQVQNNTTIVTEGYELKIFRDDLAVGKNWKGSASPKVTYSGSNGSGSFRAKINYEGTITAIGVSETLGSITYNNIIKIVMNTVVNSNGQINTIQSEYWFARDIGLIKELETSTVDNVTKTRYLTSYTLY